MVELRWRILLPVMWLVTVIFTACDRRGIVCPGDGPLPLEVAFMWDNAPGANPEGMTLYFYAADNSGGCRRFDISGRDGGRIELPPGRYDMIAVNNDLPGVRIERYDRYHSISAVTQPAGSATGEGNPSMRPTGMLYGGVVNDIEVTLCGVRYRRPDGTVKECARGLIRCTPDSLAKEYHVIFRKVNGMERVASARSSLSGMATELQLCDDVAGPDACSISFPLESGSGDGEMLRGFTSGFGAPSAESGEGCDFSLTAIVKLKNGKTYSKSYDVSAQVENFLYRNTIIIIIDGLDIPYDGESGGEGDFDVGVSDWKTVEIDL